MRLKVLKSEYVNLKHKINLLDFMVTAGDISPFRQLKSTYETAVPEMRGAHRGPMLLTPF